MEVWDVHTHLWPGGDSPIATAERLLRRADHMGIERICMYMGVSQEWDYTPTPETIRRQNDQILKVVERFPDRIFGFVYLNPNYVEDSLKELDRCVGQGPMIGIKLWVAIRASDPKLDPIVERAQELKAPVFQHTWLKVGGSPPYPGGGNLPGESTPADLVELASRHPDHPFILGHSGGDWELGLSAIRDVPNISTGLAGGDPTAGITEMAVRELGARRVIYGSDAGGRSFASQLAKVHGAAISEAEKQLILKGNLQRMMAPILERKGMEIAG